MGSCCSQTELSAPLEEKTAIPERSPLDMMWSAHAEVKVFTPRCECVIGAIALLDHATRAQYLNKHSQSLLNSEWNDGIFVTVLVNEMAYLAVVESVLQRT